MAKTAAQIKFSPAAGLSRDFTSHAGKLLSTMRKLLHAPGDDKIFKTVSLHGLRLQDLGEITRSFYQHNPVKPFLKQLQPCLDGIHEILKLQKLQAMVATLEQKTAYSVLFLSQLKVREIDWRDEIAFSINYLNFNAAEKLLQTVKKELSKPQAAEQTPKKWCRQQLFILRKPQKTAFKERGQKALSQLSNRLRYCCLNMNLFRTEFASFLPSSKVLKQLLAAIKVAEGWCDLEDSVIEFTAHTTLKGHAKLENAITKIAKNACKEAESLRDSMLGE